MSANIAQVMRDTAQIQSLPKWLRAECVQAADELGSLRAEVAMQKRSRQMDANKAKARERILRAEVEALRAENVELKSVIGAHELPIFTIR